MRWNIRRRKIEKHPLGSPEPQSRARKRGSQSTALSRGLASLQEQPGFERHGHSVASIGAAIPVDVAKTVDVLLSLGLGVDLDQIHLTERRNRPTKRGPRTTYPVRGLREAWVRAEHAAFAVAMVEAAQAFYRRVKDAFATKEELVAALSDSRPKLPIELRPAIKDLGRVLRGCGSLKNLKPQRGPGSGGWEGNVRVDLLAAGRCVATKFAIVDEAKRVVVDVLDPEWLGILYGRGSRAGSRETAKAIAAKIVDRSRAQVENLCANVRASDAIKY